jgi:uncharacterized membrane protein YhfC
MSILYVTHLLNGLLILAMPAGLGVLITRKFQFSWRLFWIGAGTFVLSQVGHIPFNLGLTALFRRGFIPTPPTAWQPLFNAIVLGLSAGLFEEFARYAAYRWWAKEARSWGKGLLLGVGHGGIEAVLIGVLVLLTYINMVVIRNADITTRIPAEQLALAQGQIQAYWSSPWYATLLGAVERAFTLPAHLALSLLVLQVFTRGQNRWLWLAVGWHAFLDGSAVYALPHWGAYATEALIGGMALVSVAIIFLLRQPEPVQPEEQAQTYIPLNVNEVISRLPQLEEIPDKLDQTRFVP